MKRDWKRFPLKKPSSSEAEMAAQRPVISCLLAKVTWKSINLKKLLLHSVLAGGVLKILNLKSDHPKLSFYMLVRHTVEKFFDWCEFRQSFDFLKIGRFAWNWQVSPFLCSDFGFEKSELKKWLNFSLFLFTIENIHVHLHTVERNSEKFNHFWSSDFLKF